jgi:spore coat polysaccharide biosynthesis predicted glycosyltransferase SpsG
MDKKKAMIFIVEGISDKEALEPIVAELLDSKNIRFEVVRGDITAD